MNFDYIKEFKTKKEIKRMIIKIIIQNKFFI